MHMYKQWWKWNEYFYWILHRVKLWTKSSKIKKKYKTITEFDWWKNKSNSRGLPKGHPFLNRENDARTKREVIKEIGDTEPENSDQENGI